MATQQNLPQVPHYVQFRVLIIGRANAGKTTILQKLCDTTESPKVYRLDSLGCRKRVQLDPSTERGGHDIEDELVFTNYKGHVFHESSGFESGGEDELKTVQQFVRRKSQEGRLNDALHAIWYCVPMDNARPELDLKHFDKICPDKKVPVIAVFTKYDQFRREIKLKLEDRDGDSVQDALLDSEVESTFKREYLSKLRESAPFVRLEGMHKNRKACAELIQRTDKELSAAVTLMLMAAQENLPRVPDEVKFRVLVIGRANAGKTTLLQRVCDTTKSPDVYRLDSSGRRKRFKLEPSIERGEHNIEDELVFSNHTGYIFHDSRGFEAGDDDNELKVVQDFVYRRSREKQLKDRLHAIWYCIPTDNARPELDLRHFENVCPDKNVPVIAVFTKYDQFRRNLVFRLEDTGRDPETDLEAEAESTFREHYLNGLRGSPPFVRLERMHQDGKSCSDLLQITANALSGNVVPLMLLAVQRNHLRLSLGHAVQRAHSAIQEGSGNAKEITKLCTMAFPSFWYHKFSFKRLGKFLFTRRRDAVQDLEFDHLDKLFRKLSSFCGNPPLSISSDDQIHHRLIVTILVLECACSSYASQSQPTRIEALDRACFRYIASGVHDQLTKQFYGPPQQYSVSQFMEFISEHHL